MILLASGNCTILYYLTSDHQKTQEKNEGVSIALKIWVKLITPKNENLVGSHGSLLHIKVASNLPPY